MSKPYTEYTAPVLAIRDIPYEQVSPVLAKLRADPPEAISMEEAELLLDRTVALTHGGLADLFSAKRPWKTIDARYGGLRDHSTGASVYNKESLYYEGKEQHWGKYLEAKCANARDFARLYTAELPEGMFTSFNVNGFANVGHVVSILRLPIEEDGAVVEKSFLVDPTLGQFFYDTGRKNSSHMVGERMMANDPVRTTALLTRGHMELSEEAAKFYATSFAPDFRKDRGNRVFEEVGGNYLAFLSHPDFAAGPARNIAAPAR